MITQAELKENLHYNQDTGIFTWHAIKRGLKFGIVAGGLNTNGYIQIRINKKQYYAHRLAWLYVYGKFPINMIDHINMKKSDNRIANLREATHAENQKNQRKAHFDNFSGYLGITFHKQNNKWMAQIMLDGKVKFLGYFKAPELAHQAYLQAKRTHHEFCII